MVLRCPQVMQIDLIGFTFNKYGVGLHYLFDIVGAKVSIQKRCAWCLLLVVILHPMMMVDGVSLKCTY
jgi:hypothetical protein